MAIKLGFKYFSTAEDAKIYRQQTMDGFKALKSRLEGKGPNSFFGETKKKSFEDVLFAIKQSPEPPKGEGSLWQAIESHTNRLMGRNGHSVKLNSVLDIFKKRG